MSKERLDVLLAARGLAESRERARAAIMGGGVYVNNQKADKPGARFSPDADIEMRVKENPFVSRGGLKLQKALREFGVNPEGLRVLDGGASTGGFTDCLLQNGASKVWAVDVGYGQLAWSLRNDSRVVCIERTNIRSLTRDTLNGETADMAVLDLSFISLALALPSVRGVTAAGAPVICLVKPQFEAGRELVGKGGVVKDVSVHRQVLQEHILAAKTAGFGVKAFTYSPIKGPKGNIEFLSHLIAGAPSEVTEKDIDRTVTDAHSVGEGLYENRAVREQHERPGRQNHGGG
ncbi:MAG: TlyA family RNA methyltransferase [Oscillospiraceae bacterium]|nr:TlyA family RNA methyltransferase [Oscillospiraceae bacterium]